MASTRRLLALPLLAALAACTPRFLAVPTHQKEPAHAVAPEADLEARFNHTLQPLDDAKTVLYLQTFGGSLGVGLLLGPIGVAANIAAVRNKTNEEVTMLKGKLPWSPAAIYAEAAKGRPELASAVGSGSVRLSPQLLVVRVKDDALLLGCALTVDQRPTGQEWKATYYFQTRQKLPLADAVKGLPAERLLAVEAELRAGFRAVTELYFDDLRGKLGPGKEITYKSEFVTPFTAIEFKGMELPGPADRAVIRAVGGMFSLPRELVEVKVPAAATASAQ